MCCQFVPKKTTIDFITSRENRPVIYTTSNVLRFHEIIVKALKENFKNDFLNILHKRDEFRNCTWFQVPLKKSLMISFPILYTRTSGCWACKLHCYGICNFSFQEKWYISWTNSFPLGPRSKNECGPCDSHSLSNQIHSLPGEGGFFARTFAVSGSISWALNRCFGGWSVSSFFCAKFCINVHSFSLQSLSNRNVKWQVHFHILRVF